MNLHELIADTLRSGEVVVLPTDTVYGLVADPRSASAMQRLFDLKGRPEGVPIAVLVGSTSDARELVRANGLFDDLAARHWPGSLTLVADAVDDSLLIGEAQGSLGVRVPDHPLIAAVTSIFGAIAATSANRHGSPTLTQASDVEKEFGGYVDLIVDGGRLDGAPSTVVDVRGSSPIVLREGAISLDHE
ncbi:MAG: threonylcarbamoyl-AMP synthase [Acidimicrobiia bacterium]|nr:threonylcarbamoyl-AMP synthase [Acidimicrobiia bacterium]RZV47835.1 MAG: threonylcarbamoyl-AMP synthase [Acidimicrobiales bacterium]